jgi:hypothetical protein
MDEVFGWGEYPELNVPARMLLAAFDRELLRTEHKPRNGPPAVPPEGAWIKNDLIYRHTKTLTNTFSGRFVRDAETYFGMQFNSTAGKPTSADLARVGHPASPVLSSGNDFLISSGSHLQTAWRGNTFSMSTPRKSDFTTSSGDVRQVEMLDSELGSYLYAKTEGFEAVVLPCNRAYMLVVLPAPGQSPHTIERMLAQDSESVDNALKRQVGQVAMPTFRFQLEANLRRNLEEMGMKGIFVDLGPMVRIPRSHLSEVVQKTAIEVDKQGIKASAESVMGGIYGGIATGQNAFYMQLNRPFVFLIRDNITNALMFLGVVSDPTRH